MPAPESCHPIRAAFDEALACKKTGAQKTILFNLSGHGHFDMAAYNKCFKGELRFCPPERGLCPPWGKGGILLPLRQSVDGE